MLNRLPSTHNGGPALDDGSDVFRIRYMRIHINDWQASMRGLTLEQEALFLRLNMLMYDKGAGLAHDDATNARMCGIDVRTYRRILRQLIGLGKIHLKQVQDADRGTIFHPRTMREIEAAMVEHQRRRAAALEREAAYRQGRVADENQGTSAEDRAKIGRTSGEDRPEVGAISGEDCPELNADLFEKLNKNNGGDTTTVTTTGPQPSRARAFPKPKPIKKEERAAPANAVTDASGDASEGDMSVPYGGVRWAFQTYNAMAGRIGLPKAVTITGAREKAIRSRLKEFGPAGWEAALAALEANPFMRGVNDRGWRADIDYMAEAKKFARLAERGLTGGQTNAPGTETLSDAQRRLRAAVGPERYDAMRKGRPDA